MSEITYELVQEVVATLPQDKLHMAYELLLRLREEDDWLDDATNDEILADEALWDAQFAASQDVLARMADEALSEFRAGKTKPMFRE